MDSIYKELQNERCYQCDKWGNDVDDQNTINDWISHIVRYLGKANDMMKDSNSQREMMKKVATLAIACMEAIDRNGKYADRHYD